MRRASVVAWRAAAPALWRGPLVPTMELKLGGRTPGRGIVLLPCSGMSKAMANMHLPPAAPFSSGGKPRKPGVASDAEMDSFLAANGREDIVVVDARNTDFDLEPDEGVLAAHAELALVQHDGAWKI